MIFMVRMFLYQSDQILFHHSGQVLRIDRYTLRVRICIQTFGSPDPDAYPGFLWSKMEKFSDKKSNCFRFSIFFCLVGLHEGLLSIRRTLLLAFQRENIQYYKK